MSALTVALAIVIYLGLAIFFIALIHGAHKHDAEWENPGEREQLGLDPMAEFLRETHDRDARARARHAGRKTA